MKAERLEVKPTSHPCPCCGQKVEDPLPFEPVVLTLETEEEASFLWHLLNNNPANSFNHYMDTSIRGAKFDVTGFLTSIKTRMWRGLSLVFDQTNLG